jgi:hypothetical protein
MNAGRTYSVWPENTDQRNDGNRTGNGISKFYHLYSMKAYGEKSSTYSESQC